MGIKNNAGKTQISFANKLVNSNPNEQNSIQITDQSWEKDDKRKYYQPSPDSNVRQELNQNGSSQFIEKTLNQQDYQVWLTQEDIANVANIKYGWHGEDGNVFEVVGSLDQLDVQLDRYKKTENLSGKQSLTFIINLNNLHWVTLVVTYQYQKYSAYYIDSFGSGIPENICIKLREKITGVNIQSFNIRQQNDECNCGIFALENARIINSQVQSSQTNPEIEQSLKDYKPTSNDLKCKRKEFAEELQHQKRTSTVEQSSILQPPKQKRTKMDSKGDKSEGSNSRISYQALEESRGTKRLQNEESELGAGQVKKLKTYPASGLKSSLHGTAYQLKLLILFLKRGLDQEYSFKLATEMDAAEKFDDVVFQYNEGGKEVIRFLQAKHKQDDDKKITCNDLFTKQDDAFSLQNYFISYRKIIKKPEFKDYKLKDFVICTNIDLEENLRNSFEPVEGEDNILGSISEKSECLKLNVDKFHFKEDLVPRLRKTSELNRLAKRLAKYVLENKPLDLKDNVFRSYHGVLGEKVIDAKNLDPREEKDNKGNEVKKNYAKFHDNFVDGSSQELENLRIAFLEAYREISRKEQMNVNEFWQKMKACELQISQTFGKVFELDINPQLTDPELFAEAIANAMSKAERGVVNVQREKKKGIIKDNINKLAGHVLIKEGNKEKDTYYLSSAFFNDNIKLPGNLESFKNKLKAELESKDMEFDKDKYKFHIANFKTCEEEQLHLKTCLPDDYIDEEEIKCFFEKLVFAVNQPNEIKLGEIIKAEMGEDEGINLIDSELIASKLQEEMLNWMKEKEGRFFTHEDGKAFFKEAKQKISKLVLIGPTLEYHAKIEEFGIAFSKELSELRNFLASRERQIFNLINLHGTILSSIKVYQTLKGDPMYQKDDSHIFVCLSSLLRLKDHVIKAFESRTPNNLLVIECKSAEENVDELYTQLSEVIRSSDNRKTILITQENDSLANKFKREFLASDRYEEKRDERSSLTDLTNESQNKILRKGKVMFQGKEVSLNTLINDESKHLLDGEVLSKLINNEEIQIGKAPTDSKYDDIKDYYIDRTFNRHVKINQNFEKGPFLVTHNSQIDEKNLNQCQDIVLTCDTDKSFKELCEKYKKYNIHWLKNDSIWQQSHGVLSKLRSFVDTNKQSIQEYRPENITDITDRVVIIAAEPGMGKSTILTHLAMQTQESNPPLWIVRINLLDYTAELEGQGINFNEAEAIKFVYRITDFQLFQKKKKETTEEKMKRTEMIENILSSITVKDSNISLEDYREKIPSLCTLEIGLFNDFFNQGSIALLFDGFDEISPNYEEKVIELLKVLKNTKVKKIWVTTRPYGIIKQLEEMLNTFSFTLKPLSLEDQRRFLEKFWKKTLKLSEIDNGLFSSFTDELLEKFSQSINDQEKEFLTIPLQTRMIAQIFQDKFKEFYVSGKQKLSDEHKKKIEETNLDTYYERFIYIKFYEIRFGEKKPGMKTAEPDMKRMIEKKHKESIADHGKLAVYSIFKEDEVRKLLSKKEIGEVKNLMKDIEQGKENTGIIERVVDNKPRFIHRTFAEYFVVNLISKRLKGKYLNGRWSFLINKIFIEDYRSIRRFFESKLANDRQLANLTSKSKRKEKILKEIINSKNPLCVAAEEGLIKTVDFLLKSAEGDLDTLIRIIDTPGEKGSPLEIAKENGHSKIVEVLMKYKRMKITLD